MGMAESWQKKEVRQVGEVVTGTTPSTKKPEYYGVEYKLISPADLDNGKFVTTAHKMLSKLGLEQCRVLHKNVVLVGCIGNVGKIGMVADEKAATNQQINAVICNSENDPHFIYYSLLYNRRLLEKAAVKTTVPILNKSNFERFELDVPLFPEQQRIAYVLSMVQSAIEQQARLIKLTRELKSALMHKLFTEGLRCEKQKETEIGPVPESWEIKPFEQFTTLQRGKDLTKDNFKNGLVPVAGSNGIIGYHDVAFVKAPGVTVGRSGSVGEVTFYDQEFWAHNTSLYVKDFHGNDPRFAAYYLEVLELGRFKTGASVPTLDRNSFKNLPIAVPPKDEQIEIGNNLSVVDKKIEITTSRKVKLEELFRTLLRQLMTGQTRVNDIDM